MGRAGRGPAFRQSQDRTGDSAYAARGGPVPSSLPGSAWFASPPGSQKRAEEALPKEPTEGCTKVQETELPQVPGPRGAPPPSTFSLPLSGSNEESRVCSQFHGFLVLAFIISSLLLASSFLSVLR